MSNNNNKLSLNSAMETLQSMFPDFDQETIKKTLYKTNGHMERTIEHLLNLQESNMNHHNYDTTSSPMSPHIPSPATTTTTTATSTVRTTTTKLRHNLPSSFLRYNDISDDDDDEHGSTTHNKSYNKNNNNNSRGGSSNKSQLQEMNDEAYARELQRKMMMEEAFHRTPNTPSSRTSTTTTTTTTSAAQKVQGAKTTKESMRGFGVNNRPVSSSFSDRMRRRLADFKDKITSRDQQQAQNKTRNRGDDDEDLWDQEDNL